MPRPRYRVGLTDGWYGIRACFDPHLEALIDQGRILVGQKLHIQTAEVSRLARTPPQLAPRIPP